MKKFKIQNNPSILVPQWSSTKSKFNFDEIHKLLSKVSVDSELNFYEQTELPKKVLILVQEILKI